MLFDKPFGGLPADVIFDNGMPESKAKAMLTIAEKMKLTSDHFDNGNGTYRITVYTGTPDASTLFWRRTERLEKIRKISASIESALHIFRGERTIG